MTAAKNRQPAKSNLTIRRSKRSREKWGFLVIWQFQVRAGMESRFERTYGPKGDWVELFSQDDSYIGTDLVHDASAASYLTLDFWTSQAAYDAFRKQHRAKYKAIDLKCEGMTASEQEIGRFVRIANG